MPEEKEIRDFYEFVRIVLKRSIEAWTAGEADLVIEVRDPNGIKKAKVKGGVADRIGEDRKKT